MRLATAALALLVLAAPASAQGRWTDAFAVPGTYEGGIFGASVYAAAPDGAGALVGGQFRIVDDVEVNSIARWTGATWEAFGGGVRESDGTPGIVHAVLRDASGAMWVTGAFDRVVQPDGTTEVASSLARWADGRWTVPAFLVGLNGRGSGYALLEEGGAVHVAGEFYGVDLPDGGRVGNGGLVRWANGQFSGVPDSGTTYALAAAPGGGVLFAAYVLRPDGSDALAIVRTDGQTVQAVTGELAGPFPFVRALRVEPDGLLVGGGFDGGRAADGSTVASRSVIRWDGAAWQPLGRGVDGVETRALARDASGLLAGGLLSGGINADGTVVASRALVRWTGSAWQAVPGDTGRTTIEVLAPLGAETLVGGRFYMRSGLGEATRRASNLAVIAPDGAQRPLSGFTGRDGTFYFDGSGRVVRLAPDGCGGVHVYAPETAGPRQPDLTPNRRWSGTAWLQVPLALVQARLVGPTATDPYVPPFVSEIAGDPASCGAFVVGGQIAGAQRYTGERVESAGVIRWDGAAWRPLGRGVVGNVLAVSVAPDGAVAVGGVLTAATQSDGTAVPVAGVARWTPAAGWVPLGGGLRRTDPMVTSGAFALLAEAGGAVVVAGSFDAVADGMEQAANNVARWTGTTWETFGGPLPYFGFPTTVSALVRWNGLLVIGGNFAQVAQPSGEALDARAVAAWDGTAWRALPGLDSSVNGLAVLDGELFASDGLGLRAARWTGTAWAPLGQAPPSAFEIVGSGRSLYLAGSFEAAGGIGSPALARFDLDGIVASEAPAPDASEALVAFPNPARTSAALRFHLAAPGHVRVTLHDALGRTVAVLFDGEAQAGEQTVRADVSGLSTGVYVARLAAGALVQTQRITVVR